MTLNNPNNPCRSNHLTHQIIGLHNPAPGGISALLKLALAEKQARNMSTRAPLSASTVAHAITLRTNTGPKNPVNPVSPDSPDSPDKSGEARQSRQTGHAGKSPNNPSKPNNPSNPLQRDIQGNLEHISSPKKTNNPNVWLVY